MRYPVQSLPDGRIRWSDGSITGAMSTNQGRVSTNPTQNTYRPPQVLGTSTGNAGQGVSPTFSQPLGDQGQASAEDQRQRELDVIRQRLDAFKQRGATERAGAQQRFSDFTTSAKSRFDTLREQLAGTVGSSLENLGQEKIGVQNLYGRAAGTARQALESAITGNRVQARAQNRLNSSFYDDRQAGTRETFGKQIADTATEEAGKLAGIGTRETEVKNYGETERQNLDREETDLVNEAKRQLNTDLAEAEQLERAGLIDYAQAENDILTRHASRLDSIRAYIENKNLKVMELAAAYGNKFTNFQGVNPQLAQLLANNQALTGAQNLVSSVNQPALSTGGTSSNALAFRGSPLENKRRDIELGLAFA